MNRESKQVYGNAALSYFVEKIKFNLTKYFPDINGYNVSIKGKALGGRFANTFRISIKYSDGKKVVFGKICPIFDKVDPAKSEYETLKLLYSAIDDRDEYFRLAVARPIDYFPEVNGYLQESVGENNLRTYVLKNNTIFKTNSKQILLENKIAGAARWLNAYHKLSSSGKPLYFDKDDFLGSFSEEFDYTNLKHYYFPESMEYEIENTFNMLSKLNGLIVLPSAKWHWDYTPGHVYLDDDKISVIDILGLNDQPIYDDIGHFLASVTAINNLPGYPFFDRKFASLNLCKIFINEYFKKTNLDRREYELMVNIYYLKYLIVYIIDQYNSVCSKSHPVAAKVFAKFRLVPLFYKPLNYTLTNIQSRL